MAMGPWLLLVALAVLGLAAEAHESEEHEHECIVVVLEPAENRACAAMRRETEDGASSAFWAKYIEHCGPTASR